MENKQEPQTAEIKPKERWTERLEGPTDLLVSAVNIYRQKIVKILALYGIAVLSFVPLAVVFGLYWLMGDGMDGTTRAILQTVLGVAGIISLFCVVFYNIAVQAAVYLAPESAESEKIMELFKRGRSLAGKYFLVSFLVGIFTLLWTLLLIVPGIIMSVYYSFAGLCLIYEGYRAGKALKRSKELTKGYWWAVVGRSLFLGLLVWLFMMVFSIPLWVVDENSVVADIWSWVVNLVSYLVAPVGMIYSYLIFKNLQKIKGERKAEMQR
ncbi:hypothetical protein GYA13_03140 [Candidatus Kuenenbacteria bacterium]|nr:hypothetical protein [Candidatus Kuenenbacteria bacterium]